MIEQSDCIKALAQDHAAIRSKLALLQGMMSRTDTESTWDEVIDITGFFVAQLPVHFSMENEIVAVMCQDSGQLSPDECQLLYEVLEEHKALEKSVRQLHLVAGACGQGVSEGCEAFKTLVGDITDRITAHLAKEEAIVFPLLERIVPGERLSAYGQALLAKRNLPDIPV